MTNEMKKELKKEFKNLCKPVKITLNVAFIPINVTYKLFWETEDYPTIDLIDAKLFANGSYSNTCISFAKNLVKYNKDLISDMFEDAIKQTLGYQELDQAIKAYCKKTYKLEKEYENFNFDADIL